MNFETIFLKIHFKKNSLNFITSYNPHHEFKKQHLPHIESMINSFKPFDKIIVVGDFNQDLLNNRGDQLMAIMNSHNFKNSLHKPIHYQGKASTQIVVFSNDPFLINSSNVVPCPFSNHSFIVSQVNYKPVRSNLASVYSRILNDKNLEEIRSTLSSQIHQFVILDSLSSCNEKFLAFSKIILFVVDEIAPKKNSELRKITICPGLIRNC